MSKFEKGDRVVINRAQIATIHTYSEENNFLAFEITHLGGAPEIVYGHVSQYDIEHLVQPAVTSDERPEAEVVEDEQESE